MPRLQAQYLLQPIAPLCQAVSWEYRLRVPLPLLLCRLVQQLDGEGMSNLGGVFDVKQVPGTQQVSGLQLGGW